MIAKVDANMSLDGKTLNTRPVEGPRWPIPEEDPSSGMGLAVNGLTQMILT